MRLLIDLCNLKSSRFACILNCELYSVKVEISWPRRSVENSVYSIFIRKGIFYRVVSLKDLKFFVTFVSL